MAKKNTLYSDIAVIPKDNVRVNIPMSPERINLTPEQINAIKLKRIEERDSINKGTLVDLGGKPSKDTKTHAERNVDYFDPIKGAVERGKSEWRNDKHVAQALAKTVGASAALATGAAYTAPVVTTWAGIGQNVLAGAVGTIGYAGLEGRAPSIEEQGVGAAMEMGLPLALKGVSSAYGKMFGRKTIAPIIQNSISEAAPKVKENIPFQIEQPTTKTLQLKSTMMGSPLEKQLSKDGMLSINSLQAHLNNPSTSMADRTMIQKVLDEKFAGQSKINYNDLRKAVSDEMVPLEKNFVAGYADYGLDRLGINKHSNYWRNRDELADIQNTIDNNERFFKVNGRYEYDEEYITQLKNRADKIKKEITVDNNVSIVYSNKEKFGRGSTDHFENEGTLGHSRILVSNEEPDVMHILEQQSDFYQKHSPEEIGMSEELMKNISRLEKDLSSKKDILNKMKTEGIDFYGNPIKPNDIPEMESLIKQQSEIYKLANADLSNITQKSLLGKTHQDRLLQENVAHAAQNGQTKMRYPTPETAAKIQGYEKEKINILKFASSEDDNVIRERESILQLLFNLKSGKNTLRTMLSYADEADVSSIKKEIKELDEEIAKSTDNYLVLEKKYTSVIDKLNKAKIEYEKNIVGIKQYKPEHQTILKKYNDNPKMIKKVLGQDTRTVTDSKGNTWFEFDIPEAFIKGKAEIKALSTFGAIATGYKAIADKNNNK